MVSGLWSVVSLVISGLWSVVSKMEQKSKIFAIIELTTKHRTLKTDMVISIQEGM